MTYTRCMNNLGAPEKTWSRYNTLFRSGRYGWHLYNALSGVILELDEPHRQIAESFSQGGPGAPADGEFRTILEEHGFLSDPAEEKLKLMALGYQRNVACFSTSHVGLVICPTLACNFACAYCFERNQDDETVMDDRTIEALLAFIRKHKEARRLVVIWYGGEPTLAFDVIETLTGKFIALFPDYADAGLVTNGYLLDQAKIDRLNDLKISSIQITVDGGPATHNRRRRLRNGGATYEQILRNIDLLMDSPWEGRCTLRMNIDKTNRNEYVAIHKNLIERYKGKNLTIYPGHVNTFGGHPHGQKCSLCTAEWGAFQLECYAEDGIAPRGGFYPHSGSHNTCIATTHQGYVVGPRGELYKCWEDVGRHDRVVGSAHAEPFLTDPALVARYGIGADPHGDGECLQCKVFPVCGGGCVNRRMRTQQFGEGGLEFCSPLKELLEPYLDAYLDVWHTRQMCHTVLGTGSAPSMEKGYRMVQPEKKADAARNPLENLTEQA